MSWFNKLKGALYKTSNKISDGISDLLFKTKLDETSLNQLEDLLIAADLGVDTANSIITKMRELKLNKDDITAERVKQELANIIDHLLSANQVTFSISDKLNIILVCGVNGNGKTTTIGKLAYLYTAQGKKVLVAACDTFRAAAKEQLIQWGNRAKCDIITGSDNQDPASLAYEAVEMAIKKNADILFIDTAGRLHNHKNLMLELAKIVKVIKKLDVTAPHQTMLVIDATTGQNAFSQVANFSEAANITGLVVTKLDGTAKAGVVIGLSEKFKLPIHFIGIGEQIDDLKPFNASEFANALVGI